MNKKFAGLLGILNRGGKLLIGSSLPLSLKGIELLITATDASENTLSKYVPKAIYLCKSILTTVSKEELGSYIGYDEISIIGIKDKKAAKAIIEAWGGDQNGKR